MLREKHQPQKDKDGMTHLSVEHQDLKVAGDWWVQWGLEEMCNHRHNISVRQEHKVQGVYCTSWRCTSWWQQLPTIPYTPENSSGNPSTVTGLMRGWSQAQLFFCLNFLHCKGWAKGDAILRLNRLIKYSIVRTLPILQVVYTIHILKIYSSTKIKL